MVWHYYIMQYSIYNNFSVFCKNSHVKIESIFEKNIPFYHSIQPDYLCPFLRHKPIIVSCPKIRAQLRKKKLWLKFYGIPTLVSNLNLNPIYIYIYIYIYIVILRQIWRARFPKLGSKPGWLKCQSEIRPPKRKKSGNLCNDLHVYIYILIYTFIDSTHIKL